MTCYLTTPSGRRLTARISRFGAVPEALDRPGQLPKCTSRRAIVRVSHASVGVTDVMAARGDYLLHPVPGFVPGYDFIGTVQQVPSSVVDLSIGQRVAGILPKMGAHATHIAVDSSLLVPVPDELESSVAATMPLDVVTAGLALSMLRSGTEDVLIQGAGGAVGAWAVQLGRQSGMSVYGTASPRSQEYAGQLGARVFDYQNPDWIEELCTLTGGGVAGAIDHTGSRDIRAAVCSSGRVVRTAFGGRPDKQRTATAAGFLSAHLHRYARPGERVCSIPMLLGSRHSTYRNILSTAFNDVSTNRLSAPRPEVFPSSHYAESLTAATKPEPGTKVVLTLSEPPQSTTSKGNL